MNIGLRPFDRLDERTSHRQFGNQCRRQLVCNHPDDRRLGEHARLERTNVVDAKDGIKLCGNKLRRHGMNRRNPKRILRRQRGKDGATVKPVSMKGAQVGLHPALPPESLPATVKQHAETSCDVI